MSRGATLRPTRNTLFGLREEEEANEARVPRAHPLSRIKGRRRGARPVDLAKLTCSDQHASRSLFLPAKIDKCSPNTQRYGTRERDNGPNFQGLSAR